MAAGDKTNKIVKITVDDETGVINYATETYVEDADGVLHQIGSLHRPGPATPRRKNSSDEWEDTPKAGFPQVIQDLATAMWTSTRKTKYEQKYS